MKVHGSLRPRVNLRFVSSFAPFLFGAFEHSAETSIFTKVLSRVSVVCGETNSLPVVSYKWITFEGIRGDGNGGCILCESEVRIEINHCRFVDVRCEGEGGALYVRNAVLFLSHSCFELCRTSPKEDQIGGNAWNVGGKEVNMSSININQCWIDTQCGDSICMFTSGVICVEYKNSSNCADNSHGEDICLEYGDFDCAISFINTINCTLDAAQSVVAIKGARKDSYSNAVDCLLLSCFIWQSGCTISFDKCCFFRISRINCYGSPAFSNCIGDFQLAGITKVDVESTQRIEMSDVCLETFRFSSQEEVSRQLLTVILMFGYF